MDIKQYNELTDELATAARKLCEEVAAHDGVDPLSEQFLLGLKDPRLGHKHYLAFRDEELVGVGAYDGESAELTVRPDARRLGVGEALWQALGRVPTWAHGNLTPAQGLGESLGLNITRRLLVMELTGEALAQVEGAEGLVNLKDYEEKVGEKAQEEWLKVNNEAFDWHPEQGGWDMDRLRRAQDVEWFNPEDVLFLVDEQGIMGFHWLKVHGENLGEIYVVGLAKRARGRGLGDPLLRAGIVHLRDERHVDRVILYVEDDNQPAVKAYEKLGFRIAEEHVLYCLRT